MTKTIPETLEACKAELKAIYEKKAKNKKEFAIICLIFAAFAVGILIGVQSGYHSALVDFGLITGTVI